MTEQAIETPTTAEPVRVQVETPPPPLSIEERMSAVLNPDPVETTPEPTPSDEGVSDSEPETVEAETTEAETSEQQAGAEAGAEAETEGVPVETLGDLAEYLGVDASELYEIKVPITGPDEAKTEVRLGEWKDTFQANEKLGETQRALAQEKEAIEQERAKIQTVLEQQATEHAAMLNAAEQQLMIDFQAVNWDALQAQDPGQWAAQRQKFGERQAAIKGMRQQAGQAYEAKLQEQQASMAQQRGAYLERETNALLEAVPEWRDESVALAEKAKVGDYLLQSGYSKQEVDAAADHRAVVMARKAMLWDQAQTQAASAKKRVLTIKGVTKPGARKSKAEAAKTAEQPLRAALKKSGSIDDAFALLQHRNRNS